MDDLFKKGKGHGKEAKRKKVDKCRPTKPHHSRLPGNLKLPGFLLGQKSPLDKRRKIEHPNIRALLSPPFFSAKRPHPMQPAMSHTRISGTAAARAIASVARGAAESARVASRSLLDTLYPPLCPGCDTAWLLPRRGETQGLPLCRDCLPLLSALEKPFCNTCGQAFDGPPGMDDFRCSNCERRRLHFDFAIAPFRSEGLLRDLIHQFKFARRSTLRLPLGRLLAIGLHDPRFEGENWIMVPVPIHRRRQRQRTFNQAYELATICSRYTGLPLVEALARTRHTPPQSRLNRNQRLANLAGAIHPHTRRARQVRDRPVLLIDDVFTTGATADICAKVLRTRCAARRVAVLTLARG